MALIHYYKFNGNLYDSIGTFDLLADINSPVYVPGKLGGSTGAVTSNSGSFYRFGCTGTGAAASGFMAADTTEAANGVLSWSMTGWVYLTSFSTNLIQLLTGTAGQSTANLEYDQKYGSLTFNGTSAACSSGAWVFFAIRVTGGASYLSVNGGAESMNTWTTNMMAMGKSLFNGIRIGSPSAFASLYAYLDDVRVFNHSLSSGEISVLYNSPAEFLARFPNTSYVYRHFRCDSNLDNSTASLPAISATSSSGTLSFTSGIASGTGNAAQLQQTSSFLPQIGYSSSTNWWKPPGSRTQTDSFAYAWWMQNVSGTNYKAMLMWPLQLTYTLAPTDTLTLKHDDGSGGLATTTVPLSDPYSLHKAFLYDGIAQRFTYWQNAELKNQFPYKVASAFSYAYYPEGFIASGSEVSGSSNTFKLDDLRFYAMSIGAIEVAEIYNSGNGTQAPLPGAATGSGVTITTAAPSGTAIGTSANGSATGAGATVTMTAPAGSAAVSINGIATGAGATVTMAAPAGAAIVPTNGSATGAGATVTMTAPAGTAFVPVNGSATGTGRTITMVAPAGLARTSWITEPIPAVTMVPPEGRVQIGAETIGPTILVTIPPAGLGAGGGSASGTGRTVTLSAPAGSATGTAAGAGTIGTVAMTPAAGTAAGSATASGAPGTVAVTAPTGGATGTAAIAAALATVTVTTTTGSAIGTAAAGGALATIAVSAIAGSATGTAAATGAGQTVAVSAPIGTLTASATTAGSLATITLSAPTATRTGGATASPAGVTVTVAAPAGGSIGTATGTGAISTATMTAPGGAARVSVATAGSLPTVAMTAAAGSATGTASTTGGGAAVAMTAPAGVARASVVAAGAPGTVTMAATAGSAAGTLTAPLATITMVAPTGAALAIARGTGNIGTVAMMAAAGSATGILTAPIGTITMVAPIGTAQAIVYGIGALSTVTMTAPGAGTITASATGNPSGVTVSVIAPAARVAPITTGGGTSVSTYDLRRAGTNL